MASLISAGVAPPSFATAKAFRSQVGQPATTAQAALIIPWVFASSTSSYSKSIRIPIFLRFPLRFFFIVFSLFEQHGQVHVFAEPSLDAPQKCRSVQATHWSLNTLRPTAIMGQI